MILKHLLLATTVWLGVHAVPVMAQDAAVEAMQEYMMFSEYESGIILPQQLDQSVFETALFVDTRGGHDPWFGQYRMARSARQDRRDP